MYLLKKGEKQSIIVLTKIYFDFFFLSLSALRIRFLKCLGKMRIRFVSICTGMVFCREIKDFGIFDVFMVTTDLVGFVVVTSFGSVARIKQKKD